MCVHRVPVNRQMHGLANLRVVERRPVVVYLQTALARRENANVGYVVAVLALELVGLRLAWRGERREEVRTLGPERRNPGCRVRHYGEVVIVQVRQIGVLLVVVRELG